MVLLVEKLAVMPEKLIEILEKLKLIEILERLVAVDEDDKWVATDAEGEMELYLSMLFNVGVWQESALSFGDFRADFHRFLILNIPKVVSSFY